MADTRTADSFKYDALIKGAPFAWVLKLTQPSTASTDLTVSDLWAFSKLAEAPSIKPKFTSASSSSGSTFDITLADNRIIRYSKEEVIIDGSTEKIINSDSGVSNASGKGEMALSTMYSPDGVAYTSPTAFLADIIANKSSRFLIVVPTGYTDSRTGSGLNRKPDGYAYMFGSLSADPEYKAGSPISLTFAAIKVAETVTIGATFFSTKGIAVHKGKVDDSTTNKIAAALNAPVELIAADITSLKDGEIVFKAVS